MKFTFKLILLVFAISMFGSINFYIGRYYEKKNESHSICAKAIELKAEEADSLRSKLDECKAVYIELNNGQKLKIIKP